MPHFNRAWAHRSAFVALAVAAAALVPSPHAHAQGFLNRIKQKAQDKVNQVQDRAAQSVVDSAASYVNCAASDKSCIQQAKSSGKTVVTNAGDTIRPPSAQVQAGAAVGGANGTTVGGPAPSTGGAVGTGVWVNWDFKPGNRPIFIEDLTHDEVGDFPRRLQLLEGNFEIVETGGRRLLRTTSQGAFSIMLPENLPDRFTFEYDVLGSNGWTYVTFDPNASKSYGQPSDATTYMETNFVLNTGGLTGGGTKSESPASHDLKKTLYTTRLMVDGAYAKMYEDDKRVSNAPNTTIPRSRRITINIYTQPSDPTFIGNFRIMAGGRKLYDALIADGHVATQGIYFDFGSERLRGESSATLKEIAQMLTDHPELKLSIEGHTDNVGAAAANQTLSERRAAAVRAALTSRYGVSADRLTSRGLGATKPVAPNTTDEGRQQNRRVELVRN